MATDNISQTKNLHSSVMRRGINDAHISEVSALIIDTFVEELGLTRDKRSENCKICIQVQDGTKKSNTRC